MKDSKRYIHLQLQKFLLRHVTEFHHLKSFPYLFFSNDEEVLSNYRKICLKSCSKSAVLEPLREYVENNKTVFEGVREPNTLRICRRSHRNLRNLEVEL